MFNRNKENDVGDVQDSFDRQMDRNWQLVEKVVSESFSEQKKARRWGIFFKLATFSYLAVLLVMVSAGGGGKVFEMDKSEKHTALVRIEGAIMADTIANSDSVVAGLRDAFKHKNTAAVIIRLNSPGGSPVQSGRIHDEILRLRKKHPKIKVYAVIDDLGASGAYYIAVAAEKIYADKASLVGSIGVTASSFGFVDLIDKLGVERRNFTSGKHKSFLDPFTPLKNEEAEFWSTVLASTHDQFMTVVKEGRGDRLKIEENPELFSGLIWNGEQALQMGLVDALGSTGFVAREIIKEKNIRDFTFEPSPFEALAGTLGVSIGKGFGQFLKASTQLPVLQ